MMGHNEENERDDRLRAELRRALPEPPLNEVDWAALRQRIAVEAAPRLVRLARGPRRNAWWEYAARWAGPALPAAFAAAAVLVLMLGRLVGTAVPATNGAADAAGTGTTTRVMLEAALGASGGTGTSTQARVMFASADDDALLRMAVTGE